MSYFISIILLKWDVTIGKVLTNFSIQFYDARKGVMGWSVSESHIIFHHSTDQCLILPRILNNKKIHAKI